MNDIIFDDFQDCVNNSLIRHKSILDIITKYSESTSKVNRAIIKAVTNCGCININAHKQNIDFSKSSIDDFSACMTTHLKGDLCENCRDVIEEELGNNLFYLMALCNTLDINLYDVLIKEYNKINTLGKFNLS